MTADPPKTIENTLPDKNRAQTENHERIYICDRCGTRMIERQCKIICHNCGHRFDCSDLNLHFD